MAAVASKLHALLLLLPRTMHNARAIQTVTLRRSSDGSPVTGGRCTDRSYALLALRNLSIGDPRVAQDNEIESGFKS